MCQKKVMRKYMQKLYQVCQCCPRNCQINRLKISGFCHNTNHVKIARAALYFYEEPSISGINGSGTIFFSGCNLQCIYCQNEEISHGNFGKEITIERLVEIMLELQAKQAHNINLVTPTHFIPSIIEAIIIAKQKGLHIPIVYNTSGYESVTMLQLLDGYIDIYLTDFKYYDNTLGTKLSKVDNYQEIVKHAIEEMYRQTGPNQFDKNQCMTKGIIVRHLCLPSLKEDSKKILHYLYNTYHDQIYISIMNQYTPMKVHDDYLFLNHALSSNDYDEIIDYALDLGISKAYMQEGKTCSDSFIPLFNLEAVEKKMD